MENKIKKVQKRDKRLVDFDQSKIIQALFKALTASGQGDGKLSKKISAKVLKILHRRFRKEEIPQVEQIQDIIEEVLILEDLVKTAKAYILYREQRREIREAIQIREEAVDRVDQYLDKLDWEVKENANMSFSLQGLNRYGVSYIVKKYWLNKIYPKEIREAVESGNFHIHNLDTLGPYCAGWDLYDLLLKGFCGVPEKLESKPPKHFRSALIQAVNFIFTITGEVAGAVAFSNFDTLLAPFIRYDKLDYKGVKQCLQEFMFNMAISTRVGFQCPFSNITLDLKPSPVFADQPVIVGGKPQKENYGEFKEEMKIFNKALYEVILEGDKSGRPFSFPIPTINITKDFPWNEPAFNGIFEASAKYGANYFANYINSEMEPSDTRSMCCRLRLDLRELYNRGGGGLFGAGSLTGSLGVVTINLPRIGYLSKTKKEFFKRLGDLMDLAKESLEIKRKAIENFIEKGLYPYSNFYLSGIKKARDAYYANHFSTIGLVGMNECLLNFIEQDIGSEKGKKLALEIMDFMRDKLLKYQEETGNIYNLEQTPAEGTSYRLALKDKKKHPGIITAGTKESPYYTNSSQLPVNYTDDVFEALKLQDEITCKYTGGSVFHIFLGEKMSDAEPVKKLIKKIFENFHLPYVTFTPTFCYDEKTEILTENGWKRFRELEDGEKVLTANPETKELSYQRPLRKFKFPYHGTMIHFKSKTFDCMVTPNHRMFISGKKVKTKDSKTGKFIKSTKVNYFVKAEDVSSVDKVSMTGYKWQCKNQTSFVLPNVINNQTILSAEIKKLLNEHKAQTEISKLCNCSQSFVSMVRNGSKGIAKNYPAKKISMSNWLKFFGIWIAEGSVRGSKGGDMANHKYEVVITQKNNQVRDEIREMLKKLPFKFSESPHGFYIYNKQLWDYLKQFGNSRTKYIPKELKMLPPKMLQLLLKWYLKGDGTKGTNYCASVSKRLRDDLQEIYLKIGFDASISNKGNRGIVTKRTHKYSYLKEIQHKVKYSGYVHCVEVPNHVIYVRRNNKPNFSGNSICPSHGYLNGEYWSCPKCTIEQPCEVYSRVVGYYRPVQKFNKGKQEEFKERKTFDMKKTCKSVASKN